MNAFFNFFYSEKSGQRSEERKISFRFRSEGKRLKAKFWPLETKKSGEGCRWISFWGNFTSQTDDSIKKTANKTSADNITGSILYLVTQPCK
jgi:hypothetical protein